MQVRSGHPRMIKRRFPGCRHCGNPAPHPRSTAGFAQPVGYGGAMRCIANSRLRPRPGAGLLTGSLRSTVTKRACQCVSR